MIILGVVAHTLGYGDACAALSVNGRVIGIIEEERFSRKRYDDTFPHNAIKKLLEMGNISGSDVNIVALHMHPYKGIGNRLSLAIKHPIGHLTNYKNYLEYYRKYGNLRKQLVQSLGSDKFRIEYYGHHLCHAAATYYSSSYESSAYLTLDGSGEGVTGSIGTANLKDGVKPIVNFPYPHSLGVAYSAICDHIGFPPPAGPGKVMGLAAHGSFERFLPLIRKMILCENGKLELDLSYFMFHKNLATPLSTKPWLSEKFTTHFGLKRRGRDDELSQDYIDLAAALQKRTNDVGVALAQYTAEITGEKNLCLGGGVALNSVMNGAIADSGVFKNVHVQPAVGDAGNSLGSIYLASINHGEKIPEFFCLPYAGPGFSELEIEQALKRHKLTYRKSSDVALEVAMAIKKGLIVGWFQGRMEYGPRALGCRSILVDPQHKNMKQILNDRVKKREWFRPFAPSVTKEAYSRYFTGDENNPYMLVVSNVHEKWREVFPAITHVDGTARVQSVAKESNPKYYNLLKCLEKIHNHPVVLNTSFNLQEPIVCSPNDAINCFLKAEIDCLCIGDYLVEKMESKIG